MSVTIKGLDKALKKIKNLPDEKRAGLKGVIEENAKIMEDDQKQNVPVDEGETKESIKTNVLNKGLTAHIGPMGKKGFKKHWLEFGTVNMPAQPFIRPSFEKNKSQYLRDLKKEMGKVK
jgi:HK97 gp10 family phage protein